MTSAREYAYALVSEAIRVGPDGRGAIAKRVAPALGARAFRTGDTRKGANLGTVPNDGTVSDPFGDGVDYVRCAHCATHWPTNASRSGLEWCHDTAERDAIRSEVVAICADTGTAGWVAERALEWADRYYLDAHVRPGCNACQ